MKLLDLVKAIKREKNIHSIENAINEFRSEYSKQHGQDNMNINDEKGDGVFFVGKNRDVVDKTQKIIGRNTKRISETTYSRAIFNQKQIRINDDEVDIISYECPLLRNKRGTEGNQFKLDLLGFCRKTNSIAVLECKYKVGDNTNPQYGLIESFFYSLAISQHLSTDKDSIIKQIKKCYKENLNKEIEIGENIGINFYVVAPRAYWTRYINKISSKNSIIKTEELLIKAIKNINLPFTFSGYVSIGYCDEDVIFETKKPVHFPFLFSETQNNLIIKFGSMK